MIIPPLLPVSSSSRRVQRFYKYPQVMKVSFFFHRLVSLSILKTTLKLCFDLEKKTIEIRGKNHMLHDSYQPSKLSSSTNKLFFSRMKRWTLFEIVSIDGWRERHRDTRKITLDLQIGERAGMSMRVLCMCVWHPWTWNVCTLDWMNSIDPLFSSWWPMRAHKFDL